MKRIRKISKEVDCSVEEEEVGKPLTGAGHVQQHLTQLENGLPIVLKQVTNQNVTVGASISGIEPTPSGPIRTTNSSRSFKTAAIPNTNPIITRGSVNSAEQDDLANLKRKINPRDDLRKCTRANSSLASIVVIPEEKTSTEPDYAQLCPPITKLGDLPAIDLSTCSLNTQPMFNSFGNYNVPADNPPSNNDVRDNSLLNAASSSLDSSQHTSQSGDGTSTSLGGGSDSTTQVNSITSNPYFDNINSTLNQFPINNINIVACNIRGLGKKSANKEFSLLCRNVNPDIILLSETKIGKDMAARKLKNMGFPCTFNIPILGRSGGLVLAWKKEIHLNVISSSLRGIYVTSTDIIHSKKIFHIHFVYGEPNSSLRPSFWEQQCLRPNAPIDDLVFFIGDFNTLLGTEDKNGGLEVNDSDFEHIRNFCSAFNLHDPVFSGPRFIWSNMQQGPDLILERLDKYFINQIAEYLCPKFCVNNLPKDSSDHCPMHIGFNYEDIWSPAYKLRNKLLSTKKGLRDWNKSSFGNIQTDISTIRKELLDLQISDPTDTSTTARLKSRLEYLYILEEFYWKEKSREVWLTEDYFKNLYSSQPQHFQDEILNDFPVKFSDDDNDTLNLPLTAEEIKNVVFQMEGKKAPGPDRFTGLFYQKNWDIVGEAVVDMTQTCFRTGHTAKVFNHTNIALIPKVPLAKLVIQYRPIGLRNLIYKILSKTLANRLKPFMNNIISQNQSAFIPKRSISDNIILANEAIYSVNHNDKVEGTAAIKLDVSKAYDKLEWSFLEKVLRKMGLAENWIKLINQCVFTVSYSFLLNGSPTNFFQLERGLRQGDPLSPYLHIICSEALSYYIDNLQRKDTLSDIKVFKNAPEMTHLLFADDSLLFTSATIENFTAIKYYLQKYFLASRKEVNFDKSGILLSRRIPEHRKALLANILDIQSRDLGEKYFGTPTVFQASKIQTHMGILQVVDAKIIVWLHKLLSQAAITTLVKHIGQVIPLFQMGAFLIPKHLCR
ncbi:uncharacterized protein LOC113305353 [Papaver somniferum]|uniref:uncharacterized protein LOC113305353 n=1 Tax=Papaver somniferum TaxID=3469 RepID=UPI000E7014DD|nr:uncharacterized protein LOC113305353 [Papaver somniferum]